MLNSTTCKTTYTIQDGVSSYPIGFEFVAPEHVAITIDGAPGILGVDYMVSDGNVIIEGSYTGKTLVISRATPFTQESDYQVGRINPEQIEYDFDRSAMRDQEISSQLNDLTVEVEQVEALANDAVETANQAVTTANQATATANTALTASGTAIVTANEAKSTATQASQDAVDAMADAASAVNKADAADMTATTAMEIAAEAVTIAQGTYSKSEIDNKITIINAGIDANADAIQRTRADFISADSDIHTILNNHASELTTLHNDVDDLGDQVSGIESKIPESASDTNQLATKADLEGLDGGDFLPLSGGTITGQLQIDVGESPTTVGETRALAFTGTVDGVEKTCWFSYMPQSYRLDVNAVHIYNIGQITPHGDGETNIGSGYSRFNTVYTNQISSASSGAIIIPAMSGTMARIEDIDAIGGDGTAGQVLTKTADGMAWQDASGGTGGGGLPDQTDNAGKFLTTDGLEVSWSDKPLVNNGDASKHNFCVGQYAKTSGNYNVCVGESATSYGGDYNTVVGYKSQIRNAGTVIGAYTQITDAQNVAVIASGHKDMFQGSGIESDSFFWVLNGTPYKLCSSDGTIPLERLTHVTDQIGDISTALTAILGE